MGGVPVRGRDGSGWRQGGWLWRLGALVEFAYAVTALAVVVAVPIFLIRPFVIVDVAVGRFGDLGVLPGMAAGAAAAGSGDIDVVLRDPSVLQRLCQLGLFLPTALVVLAGTHLLHRLLQRARTQDPFCDETVRTLSRLALLCAVGGSAAVVVQEICRSILSTAVFATGAQWPKPLPLAWLAAGMGLAAVAQVIARGVDLRSELDRVV